MPGAETSVDHLSGEKYPDGVKLPGSNILYHERVRNAPSSVNIFVPHLDYLYLFVITIRYWLYKVFTVILL